MPPEALASLAHLSAQLGADPEQVQAAGGNTSLKLDDILWVKASGLWLADALERNVFVPVRLGQLRRGMAEEHADPVSLAIAHDLDDGGLRPSIETTLHALLPHPVVVHTHSTRTIALAARIDAEDVLAERLDGLGWAFVPYAHPGVPLTRAVSAKLAEQPFDVLVMGNHGLVVGGADVEAVASLLVEVERRLGAPRAAEASTQPDGLAEDARAFGLRLPKHPAVHALAFDEGQIARAIAGSFYPDHVIFLGPAARSLVWPLDALEVRHVLTSGQRLILVPGHGVLLPADAPEAADELALCLALVLARVPPEAELRPIGPEAERALLGWDAEKYRQNLKR